MINFLENFISTTWHELRQHKHKLEWRFRELLDDAEIDSIEDQEKFKFLLKKVELSTKPMQDMLWKLIHEHKKEQLEQQSQHFIMSV